MTEIEAILTILSKEIKDQTDKLAESQSRLEGEKLDCLTMAKFQLEEYIRLSKSH